MICRLHADSTAASSTRKISASVNGEHGGGLFFLPASRAKALGGSIIYSLTRGRKRNGKVCRVTLNLPRAESIFGEIFIRI